MTHSNSGYSGSVLRLYVFSSAFCCVQVLYFFNQTPQLLCISLLVLCGYYSRVAFISLESPETSTMGWIKYVRVRWWRLVDAVSSTHSLSVLLSAVKTTRTEQITLVLVWWVHAAYTSCGYYSRAAFISFRASFRLCSYYIFECSDYLRAASVQRNTCMVDRWWRNRCTYAYTVS